MVSLAPNMTNSAKTIFDLSERVAVITGGAGLLGQQHAEAIASVGGIPILLDLGFNKPEVKPNRITERFGPKAMAIATDITKPASIRSARDQILRELGRIDILI